MLRLSSYLAVAGLACLAVTGSARADEEKWTVTEVAGAASVVSPAVAAHKVAKGEMLAPGATLTTGGDGKIVFGDGKTVVTVKADSRLTMPADPSDLMTRFAQDMGSVFFKVEKRPMAHFEVQTPLIAAVVKGTQFTVTAGQSEHAVEVSEGLVEVVAMTGGQKELVPAGRSARVRSAAPSVLKLAGEPQRQATAEGAVTRAIGVDPINYSMVTDGLVTAVPMTVVTAMTEGGSSATNGTSGATTELTVDGGTSAAGGVVADVDVSLGNAGGGGGVALGVDAGAGAGGGGGVGVGLDVGAGTGGGGGVSVGVGADLGGSSGGGVGIGVGVDVGATAPGAGSGGGVAVDVGVGVGGTAPGQSGTPGQGGGTPGQGSSGSGSGGGIGVDLGVGGINVGIHLGGKPHG